MAELTVPKFLTIQQGEYTINLNHIVEIEWVSQEKGEEEANVAVITGAIYTFENEDYEALVKAISINMIDLSKVVVTLPQWED